MSRLRETRRGNATPSKKTAVHAVGAHLEELGRLPHEVIDGLEVRAVHVVDDPRHVRVALHDLGLCEQDNFFEVGNLRQLLK